MLPHHIPGLQKFLCSLLYISVPVWTFCRETTHTQVTYMDVNWDSSIFTRQIENYIVFIAYKTITSTVLLLLKPKRKTSLHYNAKHCKSNISLVYLSVNFDGMSHNLNLLQYFIRFIKYNFYALHYLTSLSLIFNAIFKFWNSVS
jgi:hypothetical protein